jgi:hypothetical protein
LGCRSKVPRSASPKNQLRVLSSGRDPKSPLNYDSCRPISIAERNMSFGWMNQGSTALKHCVRCLPLLDGSSRPDRVLAVPVKPPTCKSCLSRRHSGRPGFLTLKRRNASLRRFSAWQREQAGVPRWARRTGQLRGGRQGMGRSAFDNLLQLRGCCIDTAGSGLNLAKSDTPAVKINTVLHFILRSLERKKFENRLPGPTIFKINNLREIPSCPEILGQGVNPCKRGLRCRSIFAGLPADRSQEAQGTRELPPSHRSAC